MAGSGARLGRSSSKARSSTPPRFPATASRASARFKTTRPVYKHSRKMKHVCSFLTVIPTQRSQIEPMELQVIRMHPFVARYMAGTPLSSASEPLMKAKICLVTPRAHHAIIHVVKYSYLQASCSIVTHDSYKWLNNHQKSNIAIKKFRIMI